MSRASSSSLIRKRKEIQKKRNIKLRKIDRRKRKMLVSKAFHNIVWMLLDSILSRSLVLQCSLVACPCRGMVGSPTNSIQSRHFLLRDISQAIFRAAVSRKVDK